VYISAFTVEYATLSAAANTVVEFYVPEASANGTTILNPNTGDEVTITLGAATATGQWKPLDGRDVVAPATTIDFSGSGDATDFIAKSISLVKDVSVQTDLGTEGVTPGDT
ncbi:hypothetical protein, partial [Pseudomonas viridiflava]|uniref:hypothetical protein n=1 Tax=Pseudomonas viridiflava TaxID=33069 RepID=UPI0013C30596